ncbi:MAG: RNA polymerase sigma factor [bacterium]
MKTDLLENLSENYRDVYRFAYRMLGSHETAEDIVQESFLRLARENPKALVGESARRWLFVVARNLCISHLRKHARQPHIGLDSLNELETPGADPGQSAQAIERSELIKKVVSELPLVLREVVILREYEGHSYAEIAALLGCPAGTVKSRLAAARETLRKRLEPLMEVTS